MPIAGKIFSIAETIRKIGHKVIYSPCAKSRFAKCGSGVVIGRRCTFTFDNIYLGDNVSINDNAYILSTKAKVVVGDHVMFGPGVTIITGDHRTDLPGRIMSTVSEGEKLPQNDLDVVIEGDNWIGANVTILKGVTIGVGSIIAAGALVNRDVEPYSVYGGVPAKMLKKRFAGIEQ